MNGVPSDELRKLYRSLRSDVIGINYRLLLLKQLYTSESTVRLLLGVAKRFFIVLRNDLLDAIMLAIGRLLDRAETKRGKMTYCNASLKQLVEHVRFSDQSAHMDLVNKLEMILKELHSQFPRILDWRNKWAAHRDLKHVQSEDPPGTSLAEIEEFILLAGLFLNVFERVYADEPEEINLYGKSESEIPEIAEAESLKIFAPASYQDIAFEDDGNTILELIRRANPL